MTSGSPATNDPAAPGTTCGATIAPHSAIGSGWLNELGHVATDAPCHRCGYNLRTIALESACPECGLATAESAPLAAREPRRLAGLRRACIALCMVIAIHAGASPLMQNIIDQLWPQKIDRWQTLSSAPVGTVVLVRPGEPWRTLLFVGGELLAGMLVALGFRHFLNSYSRLLPAFRTAGWWRWIFPSAIGVCVAQAIARLCWQFGAGEDVIRVGSVVSTAYDFVWKGCAIMTLMCCARAIVELHPSRMFRVFRFIAIVACAGLCLLVAQRTAVYLLFGDLPSPTFSIYTSKADGSKYVFTDYRGYATVAATAPAHMIQSERDWHDRMERNFSNDTLIRVLGFGTWLAIAKYGSAFSVFFLLLCLAWACHRAARQAGLARMKPAVISGGREA